MKVNIEESVNKFLSSFYNEYYKKNNLLFDNLDIFCYLINILHYLIGKYLENNYDKTDWYKISKISFLEEEKIIDSFYDKLNINFKLNDIIKDGTLEICTRDIEELIESKKAMSIAGVNGYKEEHKIVGCYNNGLITDSITLVHEISHYRNQPYEERNQINNLFTEGLAFAKELIYIDYLESLGYEYEAYISRNINISTFYDIVYSSYPLIKICLLYYELGSISKENYKLYYNNDTDYDLVLSDFAEKTTEGKDKYINFEEESTETRELLSKFNIEICDNLWYILAAPLSIYMYEEYKKDNRFIDNIERLNDTIMNNNINNKTVVECLNIIRLTNFDKKSMNKIKISIKSYIERLENNKNKFKAKNLTKK